MMAAEAGSEEGGPVSAGAGGGGAAAGSSAYPAVCRVKIPAALTVAAAPYPGLVEAGVAGTLGSGAALGSGFLGTGSVAGALGGAGLTGGGAAAGVAGAAAAGPSGEMALTKMTTSLPAETLGPGAGFPPLPPPPPLPPLGAGLGTVDEGDSLDGPEYEEEEVAIPLTAPPTNQWYHGKLDRTIAEERLRQAGKSGSYLIRESDRRPGSFVLSFLSQTNVVNHFRIIAMCGDYYIGGRRFSSLSDLIGYYSHVSCLLKGEKLLYPVAPPEAKFWFVNIKTERKIAEKYMADMVVDIDFLKGDMFIVHNELEDGWMWVTNLRTDEQGLIVEDLVEEVWDEMAFCYLLQLSQLTVFKLCHRPDRNKTNSLIFTVGQVCSFLVRPSDNTPGDYSLYFRTNENIQRFKICPTPNNQFMMGGRYYNSLGQQLSHSYQIHEIIFFFFKTQDQEQVLNDTVDGKEIYNTIRRKTKDAFYKNIVKKGYLLKKDEATTLFRATTLASTLMEQYMKATATQFVHHALKDSILKIMESKQSCEVSSLVLHIEEAHKLPVKHFTNPYCNIYLNSVQVAKTHAREGQNPVWSEEFVFDDLPPDINRFEITLSNKTKKSKDPDILFMRCQLSRLQKGHATDEWFLLSSHIPLKGIEPGSLRVRARYSMEKIMPEEEYSEFKENVPELPDTTEHSRTDLSRDLAALHEICVAHSDELRTLSNERGVQQFLSSYTAGMAKMILKLMRFGVFDKNIYSKLHI
ncbi:PREDICTED: ras GTPase-activating protein 1 [Propithecus coquereli]|uniref:ras GTPase-activating protein 1 n=1 Tax=Propithecus coquereli TaxID=379532 RepID=UPI00063F7883|nr:PREDICTED: ras GTPase-activating protein 1 [Propithecus coquereli]